MSVSRFAFAGLYLTLTSVAWAEEPYMDDRSTATRVIQSYYNAINSQQYSRAWSYRMSSDTNADSRAQEAAYGKFRGGFEHTPHIALVTGKEMEDAAVGNYRYGVPVAIDALGDDGRHEQFAGCFYLHLVSPAAQDSVPYQPLYIERAEMKPARGALDKIIPAECDPG